VEALRVLQRAAERSADPGDRRLAELLARARRGLEGAESIGTAMASIEVYLRHVIPSAAIDLTKAPAESAAGAEAIYFDITADGLASACVLNIRFASGFAPDSQQFRLLKSCAYLMTLLRGFRMRSGGLSPASRATTGTMREVPRTTHVPAVAAAVRTAPRDLCGAGSVPTGWHLVVIRFVDGRLLRGFTKDFSSSRPQLHLSPSPTVNAEPLLVPLASAKAVFFVKDLIGDPARVDEAIFDGVTNGRRMEVTFSDGEVLRGSTMNYDPSRLGFLLHPANAAGNNLRIFVISAAVRHVRFLPQQP
jgi:hypothetical protein